MIAVVGWSFKSLKFMLPRVAMWCIFVLPRPIPHWEEMWLTKSQIGNCPFPHWDYIGRGQGRSGSATYTIGQQGNNGQFGGWFGGSLVFWFLPEETRTMAHSTKRRKQPRTVSSSSSILFYTTHGPSPVHLYICFPFGKCCIRLTN